MDLNLLHTRCQISDRKKQENNYSSPCYEMEGNESWMLQFKFEICAESHTQAIVKRGSFNVR